MVTNIVSKTHHGQVTGNSKHSFRVLGVLGVLLTMVFMLAGCVDSSTALKLSEDGTASIVFTQKIDKQAIQDATGVKPGDAAKTIEKELVARYTDKFPAKITEDSKNVTITYKDKGSWLASKKGDADLPGAKFIPMAVQVVGDRIDFIMDLGKYSDSNGFMNPGEFENYYSDFTFSVTFPGRVDTTASKTNGTVEGSTVTWDKKTVMRLLKNHDGLLASGDKTAGSGVIGQVLVFASLGLLVLALIVLVSAFVTKRHRGTRNSEPVSLGSDGIDQIVTASTTRHEADNILSPMIGQEEDETPNMDTTDNGSPINGGTS